MISMLSQLLLDVLMNILVDGLLWGKIRHYPHKQTCDSQTFSDFFTPVIRLYPMKFEAPESLSHFQMNCVQQFSVDTWSLTLHSSTEHSTETQCECCFFACKGRCCESVEYCPWIFHLLLLVEKLINFKMLKKNILDRREKSLLLIYILFSH